MMQKAGQENFLQYSFNKLFRLPTNNFFIHLFRYTIAGGSAALVDWLLYYLAIILLGFHYLLAAFISFIVATAVNYIASATWVFVGNGRFNRKTEISLIYIISATGLIINFVCLTFLIEIFYIHFLWSKIIATGIVFIWNFTIRKFYVFKTIY